MKPVFIVDPFRSYIRGRLEVYPELSVVTQEIILLEFQGEYSALQTSNTKTGYDQLLNWRQMRRAK